MAEGNHDEGVTQGGNTVKNPVTSGGVLGVVKKRWPAFVNSIYGPFEYPNNWFSIQIIFWCAVMWPGDPLALHFRELSYLYGIIYITGACTRLAYGYLADRASRVKLMGFMCIGENIGYLSIGFVPEGLGFMSYAWLMVFVIVREFFTAYDVVRAAYIDDAVEESKRSQFLGIMQVLAMLVSIAAMIAIPLLLRTCWRVLFLTIGGFGISLGIFILAKAKEPQRGAEKQELKDVIDRGNVNYKYKLTRKNVKETLLSRTNVIILVEGIFTQIILAVPSLLAFSYVESAPFNVSPLSVSLCGLFFAVPGSLIGAVGFSKLSDGISKKHIKNRIPLLFVSLIVVYFVWLALFFIPFKSLTPEEGDNFLFMLGHWSYLLWCAIVVVGYMMINVYVINQSPLLQKVNLPEAQGTISSVDRFFEILSVGIGSILSGTLLAVFGGNYQITVGILTAIGACGAMLWLIGYKVIDKDLARISTILGQRATEMRAGNTSNHEKKDTP